MSRESAVDRYVREQMDRQHIPGLSLGIVKQGELVKAQGYGRADLESDVAATADTVYQIGSITKQFTAVAIMMLVEEARIGLDEPITHLLDGLPAAWTGVTLRHLLDHTSGIKSYTNRPDISLKSLTPTTREEVLALVAEEPLEFAPGERHAYNNTGYYLLGHIVERAAGQTYAEFLRARLFEPLEMNATRVNDMKDIVPNRAHGYEWAEERWRNADSISMTWPFSAGALLSTVLDLARWDAALGSEALLPRSSWQRMWTPALLNDGTAVAYGFGWAVEEFLDRRTVGHGGGIPGFITYAERYPDDGLTVIVLTNVAPSDPREIVHGVVGHFIPDLHPAGLPPALSNGTDPSLTEAG